MALNERDREDLLRDGRTMIHRGECVIDGITLLVGFRSKNQLSLYCGADPVFQFNAKGQLRRVFFEGSRLAATNGELAELVRESRGGKVQANPTQISQQLLTEIQKKLEEWIEKMRRCINESPALWRTVGEDPSEFQDRMTEWIDCYGSRFTVADSPNV